MVRRCALERQHKHDYSFSAAFAVRGSTFSLSFPSVMAVLFLSPHCAIPRSFISQITVHVRVSFTVLQQGEDEVTDWALLFLYLAFAAFVAAWLEMACWMLAAGGALCFLSLLFIHYLFPSFLHACFLLSFFPAFFLLSFFAFDADIFADSELNQNPPVLRGLLKLSRRRLNSILSFVTSPTLSFPSRCSCSLLLLVCVKCLGFVGLKWNICDQAFHCLLSGFCCFLSRSVLIDSAENQARRLRHEFMRAVLSQVRDVATLIHHFCLRHSWI